MKRSSLRQDLRKVNVITLILFFTRRQIPLFPPLPKGDERRDFLARIAFADAATHEQCKIHFDQDFWLKNNPVLDRVGPACQGSFAL